ncbi:hypothetical protein A2716_01020 [candidate division WWE3 bacterium RIFCSPHIGHO2_01_FULL_40_23]|uniref:Glycogen synthase n=1 Tax=candidate division WWE3 bacterium RIFCSPLOWO2_01_FULL_41_18 TaxID=1802625 RepID=A0A1F4VEA3_UNCKA|nr:MAG: hypothetical protein A2716_01020 [candidate division WWE3 bacterium RIFCSPHIGHO2_01_FULL_40_23]OGC55571.1 MAG: hypothetical protein A3A78_01290 [candidate division WWE3 bacterium RIFCSPLOWO2_01_FULL_41_18]
MKVLFAVSEVAPIIKVGGLGDVAGSLPKALEKLGVDVDVIVPFYSIIKRGDYKIIKQLTIEVPYSGETHDVSVYKTKIPGSNVDVILLFNQRFLSGGGVDAFSSLKDEVARFAFFNKAVVEFIKASFNIYDLIHCNDWHTGLITHLLEEEVGEERPATLLTIHNVSYQGQSSLELVREVDLSIPLHRILQWDLEDNNINFMLEGAASADAVNTVSPSYAKELLFDDIGGQISDILRGRSGRFFGILNGIDNSYFDPEKDRNIKYRFGVRDWKEAKNENKALLQKELSLPVKNVPFVSLISRLDPKQKGLDLLWESLKDILKLDLQFVLLGKGDKKYEEMLANLSKVKKYHEKLSISLGFDEGLARRIYASSDIFLMPSRTEPCGLSQMIAMRYGALPVVHNVGGLKDTVKDGIDGFSFNIFSPNAFLRAVTRAYKLYGSRKWDAMVKNALKNDFSWSKSAKEYKELYKKVIELRK